MFNNKLKATLFRYRDMSLASLTLLKRWMKLSESFNDFEVNNFNAASIRIAEVKNAAEEPLVMCPIETVYLVSAYAVSPSASPSEAQRAGDLLDASIEREAIRAGISKLLLVLPANHPELPEGEWKRVRVYERKIPNSVNLQGSGLPITSQATQFVN